MQIKEVPFHNGIKFYATCDTCGFRSLLRDSTELATMDLAQHACPVPRPNLPGHYAVARPTTEGPERYLG